MGTPAIGTPQVDTNTTPSGEPDVVGRLTEAFNGAINKQLDAQEVNARLGTDNKIAGQGPK
ncbi:MAG: hypothetical protein ACR2Q4_10710 [Geminicoccaceae bacterium]